MKKVYSIEIAEIFKIGQPLENTALNQGFGENKVSFYAELGYSGHNGQDLRAEIGTPLYNSFRGKVYNVNPDSAGYGRFIQIKSAPFIVKSQTIVLEAIYGHLHKIFVKNGDFVEEGKLIGECDNSGQYTTG